MTDRHIGQNRSKVDLSPVIPWLNAAGESVPAYGVVQFRGNYSAGYSQASKPNGTTGLFFVNGPVAVPDTDHGESLLWNRPRQVLLDGSPTVGDEVGPVEGEWFMSIDGSGWRVLHQAVGGVGVVVQVGGGSGGVEISHGVVISQCDGICNTYIVRRVRRTMSTNCDETGTGTAV